MLTQETGLILGYTRVSTQEQAYELSLVQHAVRLKAAGAIKVYADVASRTKDDRRGLMTLLEVVRSGQVKEVLVTRIDRLTSSPGLFEMITKEFQKYKVTLQVLDESVDLDSVDGELLAGLKVLLARREVRMGGLRVTASREPAKAKNRANFCAPWGYRYVRGRYELDHTPFLCLLSDRPPDGEEFKGRTKAELGRDVVELFFEAGTLSKAVRLIHQKYGIQKFARAKQEDKFYVFESDFDYRSLVYMRSGLFRWSRDGVSHYLKNPVLCGHTPYNVYKRSRSGQTVRAPQSEWDIRYNTHPDQRIMSDAQKRQIDSMLATNRALGGWGCAATVPLTGLLVCGECGRGMKCKGRSLSGRRYYQCKNYMERACTAKKSIRMDVAEQAVIARLIQKAEEITDLASTLPPAAEPPELIELRSQLAGLEALGHNPAIETAKAGLQAQIQALVVKSQQQEVVDASLREMLLSTFKDPFYWRSLSDAEKRQIYRDLLERVMVKEGVVEKVLLKI
jgi:DNA invertase Pin-like site-specific DNA recombinase